MGRLYLKKSTATIYDSSSYPIERRYENEPIERGAILLNYNHYYKGYKYDDIIILAHELVHWALHQSYFLLLQLLDDSFEAMNCTSESIAFKDTMSSREKAYWYAEWQANELSIRVAMPKHLVIEAIAEYKSETHYCDNDKYFFTGRYYEGLIERLGKWFNVPSVLVKKRLRQLGYDFADGTLLFVDDKYYEPFSFAPDSLNENETFVINRASYDKLMSENKDLAELINSGSYIYLGNVVCVYDAKYIVPVGENGKISFILSDYAREHADECCLIFKATSKILVNEHYELYSQAYLSKLESNKYGVEKDTVFELSSDANKDRAAFLEKRKENKKSEEILENMKSNGVCSFADALRYHIERKKLSIAKFIKISGLGENIIRSYLVQPSSQKFRNPSLDKVMIICNSLQLEYKLAIDLIQRAGFYLNTDEEKGELYDYLLTITNAPLVAWNQFLIEAGLPTL